VKGHSVRRGNASQLCPLVTRAASVRKLRGISGRGIFRHRGRGAPGIFTHTPAK
jgi:hypothetical protein